VSGVPAPVLPGAASTVRRAGRPDGARAYRAWRRAVLRRRAAASAGSVAYAAYATVLVTAMYGSMLGSLLHHVGAGDDAGRAAAGLGAAAFAGACVGAVALAGAGGPLWTSRREVVHVLGGQFRPTAVLRPRALAVALGAALVAAAATVAVVVGGGAAPGAVARAAALAALVAQVPVGLGVAAQVPRLRPAASGVAGALAGTVPTLWWLGGPVPAPAGPLAWAAVLGAAAGWVLLVAQVLPSRVDVDAAAARRERSVGVGAGLAAGDALAAGRGRRPPGSPRARRRGARLLRGLPRRWPVPVRDLVGLARRPARTAGSLVLGTLGAGLVLAAVATSGPPAAPGIVSPVTGRLVVGLLLLYAASGTWAAGLRAFGAQPVPGGLLPGSARSVLARHAVVPAAAGAVVVVLAAGVLAVHGGVAAGAVPAAVPAVLPAVSPGALPGALPAAAAWLALVLATRAWVAGRTQVPAGLFVPVVTPVGDASLLVVASWYVRGWLLLATVGWVGGLLDGAAGVLVPAGTAAVLALVAASRADRV
jgi:hypothetical protein